MHHSPFSFAYKIKINYILPCHEIVSGESVPKQLFLLKEDLK